MAIDRALLRRDPWGPAAAALAIAYALTFAHPIDMLTADLGRHLKTGELFLNSGHPVTTNLFSYTQPDLHVPNHHWGTGVLFQLILGRVGFVGLQLFFIALSAAALLGFFLIARRGAGTGIALMASLCAVPLLAERTEIRPEAFTYFFCAVFYGALSWAEDGRHSRLWLYALAPLTAVWANLHIYFFLGPVLIFLFLVQARLRKDHELQKVLLLTLFLSAAASLVNPAGLRGSLGPMTIFSRYGYRVAENQPVWLVERILPDPNFMLFKVWSAALAASFLVRWVWGKREPHWVEVALGIGACAAGWLAIRNFALFGLFAAVAISRNLASALGAFIEKRETLLRRAALACAQAAVFTAITGRAPDAFHVRYPLGLGLKSGDSAPADFLRASGIQGPIFNDYDIGGYLIYHLYPKERVFVDNRPEAYEVAFFKDVYVPMQENEAVWKREDGRRGFNAIVFNLNDHTPWGQSFLIRRAKDPEWAPVYAEHGAIVFLRRSPRNAAIIARHEIPKDRLRVVPTRAS
ncbi:MAG: hypothetical protein HY078_14105 [Elusimicrobia bacterium]|nr:hypothetical protein [Elusimicrobiota bacterium]